MQKCLCSACAVRVASLCLKIMSQKRKLEEYHDPDYPQTFPFHKTSDSTSQPPEKICKPNVSVAGTSANSLSVDTRKQKIVAVVKREFESEIKAKEREIDEIERRILCGRQLLAKVRYAVIHSYYTKKNLVYPEQDIRQFEHEVNQEAAASHTADNDRGVQMPIHPSLKKILGKRPLDYNEILKVRPVRRAAKNATEKFQELKKPAATKLKMLNITIPAEPVSEVTIEANETEIGDVEVNLFINFQLIWISSLITCNNYLIECIQKTITYSKKCQNTLAPIERIVKFLK